MQEDKKYYTGLLGQSSKEEDVQRKRKDFLEKRKELMESPVKDASYISPLEDDTLKVKGYTEPKPQATKLSGMTEHIDTRQVAPITSGSDFQAKIASRRAELKNNKLLGGIGKGLSKGLKALPIIGGVASMLSADEASAAIPLLDSAESTGPIKGSLDYKIEQGLPLSEEDLAQLELQQQEMRMQALNSLKGRR